MTDKADTTRRHQERIRTERHKQEETDITDNSLGIAYPLTLTDAGYLSDILRGVEQGAYIRWYPRGTDSADNPIKSVMRAITHEGGGLWFDSDGDVRNAYIWTSGIWEHWLPVREVMSALRRMTGSGDMSQPLATIDFK